MTNNREVALNLVEGLVAGAAATWLMGRTTTYIYVRASAEVRRQEDEARGGETAYALAATRIGHALGFRLSHEQGRQYGNLLHWAQGTASGLAFALLSRRFRNRMPAAGGVLFGLALWAAMDEGALWASGLTPGPLAFPWQTHARGLAGHLVFGGATKAALDLMRLAA